jgi:hypothetical protein
MRDARSAGTSAINSVLLEPSIRTCLLVTLLLNRCQLSRLVYDTITMRLANIDRASQVLAQGVPPGVPRLYRALTDHGNIPRSTLYHRARGRRSMEEKARSQ